MGVQDPMESDHCYSYCYTFTRPKAWTTWLFSMACTPVGAMYRLHSRFLACSRRAAISHFHFHYLPL
jgi:hypothetical protein